MNKDFVPYELALKLKEKGFREKCFAFYYKQGGFQWNYMRANTGLVNVSWACFNYNDIVNGDKINAPTIFQVLKWLRKEKDVVVSVNPYYGKFVNVHWWWDIRTPVYKVEICSNIKQEGFASYEEAAIAGIEYVIDNLI